MNLVFLRLTFNRVKKIIFVRFSEGLFLVRESSTNSLDFALSVVYNNEVMDIMVLHFLFIGPGKVDIYYGEGNTDLVNMTPSNFFKSYVKGAPFSSNAHKDI